MMSASAAPNAETEAIDWAIRLRDSGVADWNGFTIWLEANPRNSEAYDRVALADADLSAVLAAMPSPTPAPIIANDNQPRWALRFAGVAAAILALVSYPAYQAMTPTYTEDAAAGAPRSITIADGSVIDLNGGTRVTLDKRNPRLVMLEHGEARFHVKHDDAAPFTVRAGGAVIEDVGTIFNVTRENGQTDVAVAEGSVLFNPRLQNVLLVKGRSLRARDGQSEFVTHSVDPASIGGWTSGRLSYEATPYAEVAAALSRSLGTSISVSPSLTDRRFTGTILIDRKDPQGLNRIAALMGVAATRNGAGWQFTAH